MKMHRTRRRQSDATLLITMIFVVIFLLLVISLVSTGIVNTKVTANQQHNVEAVSAAQQGIEQVISQDFTSAPVATTVPVDVNGDGKADYTAQVATPVCQSSTTITNTQLDVTNPDDVACFVGNGNNNTGIIDATGGSGGNSLCNTTQWDVSATVSDAGATNANATLHQGIGVRVPYGTACP